jgi:sugar phosphate isomerase/epimerase/cytochrome c551/c552
VNGSLLKRSLLWWLFLLVVVMPAGSQEPPLEYLFRRENLVAWCIVPFDAKKRGPEERAAMLKQLGFSKFAYDYRAEHIPTFDAEMEALKKQGIELTAWWFPGALNDEARGILEVLKRHELKPQLWVTGGGESTKTPDEQQARIKAEADRIRPIAEAAAKIGCTVALYNHGGWFGEPENQLAVIEELKLPNVGLVYNQHHGHDHLDRFPALLKQMLPHLVCLNLNGMTPDGEQRGQKILPLGQGELDLGLLKTIKGSGYRGPIGILGHTQDDAEARLKDNLDGLDWLVKQLDGGPAGAKPKPRTPVPAATAPPKQANKPTPPLNKTPPEHWGRGVIGFDWKEADSVDNRWNQTDIGPFLASIVPIPQSDPLVPNGQGQQRDVPSQRPSDPDRRTALVAKGLSIKVGDRGQGTVCYDTQTLALRASWTGGFLKFDPARYGLINSPRIAGEIAFASSLEHGWSGKDVRYLGLHVNDKRVVLSASVNGTLVRESPWLEEHGDVTLFTRTFEVAPTKESLVCQVGQFSGRVEGAIIDGVPLAYVVTGDKVVVARAQTGVRLGFVAGAPPLADARLTFPASDEVQRSKVVLWAGDLASLPKLAAALKASGPAEDLAELAKPSPPRRTESIVTQGKLGRESDGPYVVDTLTLPFDNPYKALLFVGGHDFFANGDVALCTVHGDVWRVSGVDDKLQRLTWKRVATGLFQPLGLKIVEDHVHVLGRDQITRLVDHNGDGEADEYQCFSNAWPTSPGGHDYVTCLETSSRGEFHFVHATEGLLRVAKDGSRVETVAAGFRNPNGMGWGPGDVLTVAPQEGEWTPGSVIFEIKPGGYYGYGGPKGGHGPAGHDPPLAWLPRMMDNSSGGQVWATSDRWGPLGLDGETPAEPRAAHLLHLSYGKCRMMLVLRERAGDMTQGAVIELPGVGFSSGAMRGRFSPHDGQLYVSGLKGWASAAVDDGCLQRVRYTGQPVVLPIDRQTYANGLAITFSQPLEAATAEDPGSYHLEQWNYRYSAGYGSPDLKLSDPNAEGHDEVPVRSATLLPDGRTVFLEIPDLKPANQTSIEYSLRMADGQPLRQTLVATTHVVPERRLDEKLLHRRELAVDAIVDESALAPGVKIKVTQGKSASVRTSRLVAWHVTNLPAWGPPRGAFDAMASGFVKVPLRGEYAFHLTGTGSAKLRINGKLLLDGMGDLNRAKTATAPLRQGYNRLEVEYSSPPEGASELRLWWTDGTFAPEPVPPTALYHDSRDEALRAADQLRRGGMLAGERRCEACHAMPGERPRTLPTGPSLADAGSRLEPRWMYHWLLDPAAIRPHAHMPRLFAADQPADRQAAADIAAYLATLTPREGAASREDEARAEPRGSAGASPPQTSPSQPIGASLFEDLGCIACHRLTPPAEDDAYDRLPVAYAAAKFRPGKLAAFLREPQEHYAYTRMPDFALSNSEAAALAAHLSAAEGPALAAPAELTKADAARGQTHFRERLCAACHAIGPQATPSEVPAELNPLRDLSRGCLATNPGDRKTAPHYRLSPGQAGDLMAFLSRPEQATASATPVEMLPQLMERLRCEACHNRDHDVAPLRRIIAEETEHGLAPDGIPNLTWAGEKLHGDWLSRRLAGRMSHRTRPWLKGRMPAYPYYADLLSEGLMNEHGLSYSHAPTDRQPIKSLAAIGDRLTRKDGGLDCRSCHGVGKDEPTGDERTKVAQGINFAHSRERLRKEFYLRFVLDPPRHDVTTRMPKLSANGKTTSATAIQGGDARKQFEAIWEFIQTARF